MQSVKIQVEKTPTALALEQTLNISWNLALQHEYDAGFDVRAAVSEPVSIPSGETRLINTGLKFQILDPHWEIQVRSRSGLAAKNNVFVLNSPGTVDYLYTKEVLVILHNAGREAFVINPGDRIAQICVREVPRVEWLYGKVSTTERSGFGSTGTV